MPAIAAMSDAFWLSRRLRNAFPPSTTSPATSSMTTTEIAKMTQDLAIAWPLQTSNELAHGRGLRNVTVVGADGAHCTTTCACPVITTGPIRLLMRGVKKRNVWFAGEDGVATTHLEEVSRAARRGCDRRGPIGCARRGRRVVGRCRRDAVSGNLLCARQPVLRRDRHACGTRVRPLLDRPISGRLPGRLVEGVGDVDIPSDVDEAEEEQGEDREYESELDEGLPPLCAPYAIRGQLMALSPQRRCWRSCMCRPFDPGR